MVCTLCRRLWLRSQNPQLLMTMATADGWHKRLRHPSSKIVQHLIRTFSLPINENGHSSLCVSCSLNKAHRQMFNSHGLNSTTSLELIYTNVWGSIS